MNKLRDLFLQSDLLESSDFHVNENSISYLSFKPMARVEVNRCICTMQFPDEVEESKPLSEFFTISDKGYKQYVKAGVEYCQKGDLYQMVLSQRFVQPFSGDDFKVYRALRSITPLPYLFYFDFGGYRIFGSSPETHCKIDGKKISIDLIAGTTKLTGDYNQDIGGVKFLFNDTKENAEHVMLVDLALNDLSRNAHSVEVEFFIEPQFYSHVIHLISRVSGLPNDEANSIKSISHSKFAGIDINSRFEVIPGIKDTETIKNFIKQLR